LISLHSFGAIILQGK